MSICGTVDDEQGVQYLAVFYHSGDKNECGVTYVAPACVRSLSCCLREKAVVVWAAASVRGSRYIRRSERWLD
jgi:hypothetical protein